MTITPLKELTFDTTNLAEDTTAQWDMDLGYTIGTIRQKDNKLYKALDIIDKLATYYYDDTDPLNEDQTTLISTGIAQDASTVICTVDETVVYVKGTSDGNISNKYFVFDNSTGTTNNGDGTFSVDFTAQDTLSPSNFTEVTGYRNTTLLPAESPTSWKDLGYTNKYKCLDKLLSSQTVHEGNMEMSFITKKVDKLYLFNILCNSVDVVVTELTTNMEVFNQNFKTRSKNSRGTFWGLAYNDFTQVKKISAEIPIKYNVRVDITLNGTTTKCGLIGLGRSEDIGATLYGLGGGVVDFSKIEEDENGDTYIEKGKSKKTNSVTLNLEYGRTDSVVEVLNTYLSTPIIFEAVKGLKSTQIYGIYEDYTFTINTPKITRIKLNNKSML